MLAVMYLVIVAVEGFSYLGKYGNSVSEELTISYSEEISKGLKLFLIFKVNCCGRQYRQVLLTNKLFLFSRMQ
jgi:hypothetical protein